MLISPTHTQRALVVVWVALSFPAVPTFAQNIGRGALGQWWTSTPRYDLALGTTPVGLNPSLLQSDGEDIWVANNAFPGPEGTVSRVHAADGRLLETWTGASGAFAVLVAMGRIFVTGASSSRLYMIDPVQPPGDVTPVATIGPFPGGVAFDGARIWTANGVGSVSIVTPTQAPPWPTATVSKGFAALAGIVYDGSNIWVTDIGAGALLKLDSAGSILQTVPVGSGPQLPVFDGRNIWVPNRNDNTVSVVCAATGDVITTLSGNGLSQPTAAAFDGQRVLIANFADRVSLWNASDTSPLGNFSTGAGSAPVGVASNGVNFWIALRNANKLARF